MIMKQSIDIVRNIARGIIFEMSIKGNNSNVNFFHQCFISYYKISLESHKTENGFESL